MGNLIGVSLPIPPEDANEHTDNDEDVLAQLKRQREFNKLLYADVVDPLIPEGSEEYDGEVDVVFVTGKDPVVIDYKVVRASRLADGSEAPNHGQLFGSHPDEYDEWIAEIWEWAASVEGGTNWYWVHVHPEGMALPSDADEAKTVVMSAQDLINMGHPGGSRRFQGMIVNQRSGIVALQAPSPVGAGPISDAKIARIFANSYARILPFDDSLVITSDEVASALEEFVQRTGGKLEDMGPAEGMELLMWGMTTLLPLQEKLNAAKDEHSDDEMRQALKDDYLLFVKGEGGVELPRLGFGTPVETTDEEQTALPSAILDSLAGFNFDSLDA